MQKRAFCLCALHLMMDLMRIRIGRQSICIPSKIARFCLPALPGPSFTLKLDSFMFCSVRECTLLILHAACAIASSTNQMLHSIENISLLLPLRNYKLQNFMRHPSTGPLLRPNLPAVASKQCDFSICIYDPRRTFVPFTQL